MKLILCVCLVFLCAPVFAAEKEKGGQWYVKSNETGDCTPETSPAQLIEDYKELGKQHRVIDESTKNGKPIIVRVYNLENNIMIRFFRTKAVCESYLAAKKKKDSVELNRYR